MNLNEQFTIDRQRPTELRGKARLWVDRNRPLLQHSLALAHVFKCLEV